MPDLGLRPWRYDRPTRRQPRALAVAALGLVLIASLLAAGASILLLLPAATLALGGVLAMALGQGYGTRLSVAGWQFHAPFHRRRIPLGQIDHVTFARSDHGSAPAERITLHLTDGTTYQPPAGCLPSADALRPQLARARIRVA